MKSFSFGSSDVAKRLECDDDKARFEAKPGKLVKSGSQKGT
jgi:hypothetical protein